MGQSETWVTLLCPKCKNHVQVDPAVPMRVRIWRCPYCSTLLTRLANEERS